MVRSVLLALISGLIVGCSADVQPSGELMTYSTSVDSAAYYYRLGWKEIMDDGWYGPAETSYRKSLAFDPDFLLAKSTLARLTLDRPERLRLYRELLEGRSSVSGAERLALDVYIGFTHFTNLREAQSDSASMVLGEVLSLAERNFGEIIRTHPEETYLKAEFFEVLHSMHGPEVALDSLRTLSLPPQRKSPFIRGFEVSLLAETGDFTSAQRLADSLAAALPESIPKPHAVYADLYFQMDSLSLAREYAARAVALDGRNLDASRLLTKAETGLNQRSPGSSSEE
jgi:tetratricopeptide (TPR) repeat protein